jgi:hypothetical protein
MIARAGTGWQYVLTDLSLILFMVTAAALSQTEDAPARPAAPPPPKAAEVRPLSPQSEPLALYRAEPGAPPLAQWLRDQSVDSRQQLTIVAQYQTGGQVNALQQAQTLAHEAGEAGVRARIVVEPGRSGTSVMLAYDAPEGTQAATEPPQVSTVAQPLH